MSLPTFSRFPFQPYPMNNVTPFTYRDGYTFLERLEVLQRDLGVLTVSDDIQGEAINDFVAAVNATVVELLSQLVGYTIEVNADTYTASMMDGSTFSAYTLAGVDSLLEALSDSLTAFVEDNITEIRDENTVMSEALQASIVAAVAAIKESFKYRHNVLDYGAKGDGIANDTPAIVAAIAAAAPGEQIFFPDGKIFRVQANIPVAKDDLTFTGTGKIVVANYATMLNTTLFTVTGNRFIADGIRIDGGSALATAFSISGDYPTVRGCTIENLKANTVSSRGVWVQGRNGCRITNNTIRNIEAVGDGITGNENGAARAIVLSMNSAALAWSYITGNTIDNIYGEEGDAIHVLVDKPSGGKKFARGYAVVADNKINEFNKRGVKIQAGSCIIKGNIIASGMPANVSGSYYGINMIHNDDCEITGNTIIGGLMQGISVQGNSEGVSYNNVVQNNIIRGGTGVNGIYGSYNDRFEIRDNSVSDNINQIRLEQCKYAIVRNNQLLTPTGIERIAPAINIDSGCWRGIIDGNFLRGNTANVAVINVESPDSSVTNNHDIVTGSQYFVRAGSEARQLTVSNNRSISQYFMADSLGTRNDLVLGPNYGAKANKVIFTVGIPTTSMSNTDFFAGDIAFNVGTSNATVTGWICTANGKPGTWRVM